MESELGRDWWKVNMAGTGMSSDDNFWSAVNAI